MSFAASVALQGAVYQCLRGDAALHDLVGDAIFDAMPVEAPAGVFVSLGPEDVRDAGDRDDLARAGAVDGDALQRFGAEQLGELDVLDGAVLLAPGDGLALLDLAVEDAQQREATVGTADRTGVEMEALTSVSVAALAIVDMVKGMDKAVVIEDVRIVAKSGAPPLSRASSEASLSTPPSGQSEVNSGQTMWMS